MEKDWKILMGQYDVESSATNYLGVIERKNVIEEEQDRHIGAGTKSFKKLKQQVYWWGGKKCNH
jgi:hypothetical protein